MNLASFMNTSFILAGAVAGSSLLIGCADESAPNRRGIERPPLIQESIRSKDNAEHRELEGRQRELPSGGGKEFPGQSKIDNVDDLRPIALFSDRPTPPGSSYTDYRPIMTPGKTAIVPGTGYSIDPSWGAEKPLASADRRPWPAITYNLDTPGVQHNPYYTRSLFTRTDPSEKHCTPILADLLEIPWFYIQLPTIPVQAIFNPPFAQNTSFSTNPKSQDGLYEGYLPAEGAIFPTPVPGKVQFIYPFDNDAAERNAGGVQQLEPSKTNGSTPATQPKP